VEVHGLREWRVFEELALAVGEFALGANRKPTSGRIPEVDAEGAPKVPTERDGVAHAHFGTAAGVLAPPGRE
jgi:hypothetical protein